jgi:hypothetical protein
LQDDASAGIGQAWDLSGFGMNPFSEPANLQIWYNGTRTVRVHSLTALVYAPNAVVELPFNSSISGAIVARRIVGEGNNRYSLDTNLIGKTFSSGE